MNKFFCYIAVVIVMCFCVTNTVNAAEQGDFKPLIVVNSNSHGEIYVEYTSDKEWPGAVTVETSLGKDNPFEEGEVVRVYYINPVAKQNEFKGTVIIDKGCANIVTDHSSLFLLTRTDYGEVYVPEAGGETKRLVILAVIIVMAAGAVAFAFRRKRDERVLLEE